MGGNGANSPGRLSKVVKGINKQLRAVHAADLKQEKAQDRFEAARLVLDVDEQEGRQGTALYKRHQQAAARAEQEFYNARGDYAKENNTLRQLLRQNNIQFKERSDGMIDLADLNDRYR